MRNTLPARLRRDARGIAAVEFAFIAPILMLGVSGLMEYSYVSYARSSLESSTIAAARLAMAGRCSATREADMRALVTRAMGRVKAAGNRPVTITVKAYGNDFGNTDPEPFIDLVPRNGRWNLGEAYTDVNGNGKYDEDMGVAGNLGGAGEVVSYTTSFDVVSFFPMIARRFNNGNNFYTVRAATVVRNEPDMVAGC